MQNEIKFLYLDNNEVSFIVNKNYTEYIEIVEEAFKRYYQGKVILPDKTSQIFDLQYQNRINCLPATLVDECVSGIKWVSVFPSNALSNLINLTGLIILSSTKNGFPLSIMDGTYITAIRTAAVGALAVKSLSNKSSEIIGFIGSGEQAKMHFRMIYEVRNLKKCFVASRTLKSEMDFVEELQRDYPSVTFTVCDGNYKKAVENADIIVTAISSQEPLLKAEYIKQGATYIHVGGWEDEYQVAKKADKIICDNWENVKHRSQTISKMYKESLLSDDDIYGDLDEILFGSKVGREHKDEFIYFNSVGLAYIDIMFAYHIYNQAKHKNIGRVLDL